MNCCKIFVWIFCIWLYGTHYTFSTLIVLSTIIYRFIAILTHILRAFISYQQNWYFSTYLDNRWADCLCMCLVQYVDPTYKIFHIYLHPIVPVYVTTGNLLPSLNIYDHSNNLCGILSQIRRKVEDTHRNRYWMEKFLCNWIPDNKTANSYHYYIKWDRLQMEIMLHWAILSIFDRPIFQ